MDPLRGSRHGLWKGVLIKHKDYNHDSHYFSGSKLPTSRVLIVRDGNKPVPI